MKKIGLFIPCYVNAIYPEVGVSTFKILSYLGFDVDYPMSQTCCGQPMANAGFEKDTLKLIHHFDKNFKQYDYIVAPSASCVVFVKKYPHLVKDSQSHKKIYEICEFLHDVVQVKNLPAQFPHKVSIHNSCHGVQELYLSSPSEQNIPIYSKLKNLLSKVEGIEIMEPQKVNECCGFGGLFSMEEPDVSIRMGEDKIKEHIDTGASYITGADSSCLMHMSGIISKQKLPIKTIHIIQILSAGL